MKAVKIINLIVASIVIILMFISRINGVGDLFALYFFISFVLLAFAIVFVAEKRNKKEQTPAKKENDVIERLTKENQLLRENNELRNK